MSLMRLTKIVNDDVWKRAVSTAEVITEQSSGKFNTCPFIHLFKQEQVSRYAKSMCFIYLEHYYLRIHRESRKIKLSKSLKGVCCWYYKFGTNTCRNNQSLWLGHECSWNNVLYRTLRWNDLRKFVKIQGNWNCKDYH